MKTYTVGGAVRDTLLGLVPKDLDYVVVGATAKEMVELGFSQVGADFPVFLHPETGDEYALARREHKTGKGYLGFTSEFGTDVTLEEDLGRRDLSINSMAFDEEGNVVDPFGGRVDLENKVLRHTSNAFEEDPVRVLRLARFRARLGSEWKVADETKVLVSQMSKKGVLSELNAERVWKEMSRALMEKHPRLFFDTLLECDALHTVFPELYKLKTALESRRWHPEGDAFEHTMLVLTQAAGSDLDVMFAVLAHDMGKGLTKFEDLPSHYGHDVKGVKVVEDFANRLTVPSKIRDAAMFATRYHMLMHQLDTLNPKTFVKMFSAYNAMNDRRKVEVLHAVGVADHRGRLGSENESVDHLDVLFDKYEAVKSVKFADVFPKGETNVNKIKDGMYRAKVQALKA